VGNRFVIKPSREEYLNKTDRMILDVDPASSYEPAPTTPPSCAIEQLERYVKEGAFVLDMGCGSGILSIAALLLGAERVAAVDTTRTR
jgi:ribosomal protein L11 methyltransferase